MVSVRPSYGAYLDEYYGLSTDTKPVHDHVVNGSTFIEIDTSREFRYDKQYRRWYEYGEVQDSSGNSPGDAAAEIVELNFTDQGIPYIAIPAGELLELCSTKNVIVEVIPPVGDVNFDKMFTRISSFITDNAGTYYFFVHLGALAILSAESAVEYPIYRSGGSGAGGGIK